MGEISDYILRRGSFEHVATRTHLLYDLSVFQKSRLFPKFFIYEYVATILFYPLDVIFSAATLSAYTGQPIATLASNMVTPDVVGPWIAALITAAIWIPYIKLSKRVANTFA
jgi:hypothetical protein